MQSQSDKHLYEYAVVRFVPRVEREEFINVGLVMMCKRRRWLRAQICCDKDRITALFGAETDIPALRQQLQSFLDIAEVRGCSPIAGLETHERFRWLTAVRSASIATSRPHPGTTTDLDDTFARLFAELVE